MQKSILITGCSSGIGFDAATALKERGWTVIATCRQEADCKRLREMGLDSFRVDHTDMASVRAAPRKALEITGGTLDALFNNGAHGMPGAVEDVPVEGLRAIFEANFFGVHELTRLVIPIMRGQGHGRVIQCSSVLGFSALKWRGGYVSTKYALEGLTDTLRMELADSPIKVILIEPGPITTRIRENSRPHFEKWINWKNSAHRDLYEGKLMKRLYEEEEGKDPFVLPPSAVTKKLIHALESPRPRPRYYVTTATYLVGILKRFLSTRMMDRLLSNS